MTVTITCLIPHLGFAADWITLSPTTLNGSYYRALSANEQAVIAFGSYGSITSYDNGKTWEEESSYSHSSAYYVSMESGMIFGDRAVAVGGNGVTSLSVDTGESWLSTTSPVTFSLYAIDGEHVTSTNTYTLFAAGILGTVIKSDDGGETWADVSLGSSDTLWAVGVASRNIAWVGGDNGVLYKTEDGGASWILQDLATSFDINTISVVDRNTIWVAGEGEFLAVTNDGGSSWTQVQPTERNLTGEILSLVFINEDEAYMSRTDRCIWYTSNAGSTWTSLNTTCTAEYSQLAASSNGQVYAAGSETTKVLSAYDEESPSISAISTQNEVAQNEEVTLTVTATDNYTIENCIAYANESSMGTLTQHGDEQTFSLTHTFATEGTQTVVVTCTDTANNATTTESATIRVTENASSSTEPEAGDLIKTACSSGYAVNDPCTAVYYLGSDGYRHAFTNEQVYFSWYANFDDVRIIDSATMASYLIGQNVTYKPGITMVKFLTVRTVYAVEEGGILHGIASEALAETLYGSDWNTQDVDDISDAFYSDYTIGTPITNEHDYNVEEAIAATTTINENY